MKILTFSPRHNSSAIMEELKAKVGSDANLCHSFQHTASLVVPKELYEKHKVHFDRYMPHVEDNVTIRLHAIAEREDNIPWGVEYVGGKKLWQNGMGNGIKVAVIDTGIYARHPDLRGRVRGGYHFVKGKMNGHGTHVAGTIAASMNHYGIVGVAPEVELYDVRAFNADGSASLVNIIHSIDWSIQNKMQVVNMSFGMPDYSRALDQAVRRATEKRMILVASAGNNGRTVEFPARYGNVIGVGAIDKSGRLANFSSRGIGMDRTAPGVGIYSTWLGNSYKTLDGTSMAAPHVTGLMALRLAERNKYIAR